MSLGLRAYHSGGEFSPRIEYNAKAGRMTRVDRAADDADVIRIDLTMSQPMFAWDIGSIEIGWINFQNGATPSFDVVPFGQSMPPRPDRAYKAGFRSKVWEGRDPVAREFSSTAGATVNAIEALWDTLRVAKQAFAGQVPVLQFWSVEPVASPRGTNYAPVFRVVQWIDRDERVFGRRTVAAPGSPPIPALPVSAAPPLPVPAAAPIAAVWAAPEATPVAGTWPTPAAAPVAATWPVAA